MKKFLILSLILIICLISLNSALANKETNQIEKQGFFRSFWNWVVNVFKGEEKEELKTEEYISKKVEQPQEEITDEKWSKEEQLEYAKRQCEEKGKQEGFECIGYTLIYPSKCNKNYDLRIDKISCIGNIVMISHKSGVERMTFEMIKNGKATEFKKEMGSLKEDVNNVWISRIEGASAADKVKIMPRFMKTQDYSTGEITYEVCRDQVFTYTIPRTHTTSITDLSNFPRPFIVNDVPQEYTKIIQPSNLNFFYDELRRGVIIIEPKDIHAGPRLDLDYFNEVTNLEDCNIILIESGQKTYGLNQFSPEFTKLTGWTKSNWPYKEGEGIIKIIQNGRHIALIIAGTTIDDTRKLIEILTKEDMKALYLKGTEFIYKKEKPKTPTEIYNFAQPGITKLELLEFAGGGDEAFSKYGRERWEYTLPNGRKYIIFIIDGVVSNKEIEPYYE